MNSRREFLVQSSTVALSGLLTACAGTRSTDDPLSIKRGTPGSAPILKVGLVGCGGRGSGATVQALMADPNTRLTALGDVFADRLQQGLMEIQAAAPPGQIAVTPDTSFVGLDAYQRVIDSGVDVVLLATPPAFRPQHLRAAIDAGKHVFCEKPVAVDAPGIRAVLEVAVEAQRRQLALVSGFCYRYHDGLRECMRRIHRGAIGEVLAVHAAYYTNTLTTKFLGTREPGWTDLEWQLRNWYYFQWLSGDHLVEQAVHSVDKAAWAMGDEMPVRAIATGGRQVPGFGDIYDHYHVTYDYAGGQRAFVDCRQQDEVHRETVDYVIGSRGVFSRGRKPGLEITGRRDWKYTGTARDMYEVEHIELFASIRAGRPINDGFRMARSTLMAIMGRMAAYTGQAITWEQALNSQQSLVPASLDWGMTLPMGSVPVPGKTTFA